MKQSSRSDARAFCHKDMQGTELGQLVGRSPAFLQALEWIHKSAQCNATVLIEGETGTGKELAARAIHYMSARRDRAFIPVNCGALPENLLESELYGHERGAFTDAREPYAGLVAQADGGTLLLDEIEAMSCRAQIVLLRFLQDHHYRMIGGKLDRRANVRVIASSNADIETMTRKGAFRCDLYFRLNVLAIRLPALRDRPGDAELLAREFSRRMSEIYQKPCKDIHPDTLSFFDSYAWPGNVRELENMIHRDYLFGDDRIMRITQPDGCAPGPATADAVRSDDFKSAKTAAIVRFERSYLLDVLGRTGGNISAAARMAGKERSAFSRLVKKHWPEGRTVLP